MSMQRINVPYGMSTEDVIRAVRMAAEVTGVTVTEPTVGGTSELKKRYHMDDKITPVGECLYTYLSEFPRNTPR